MAGGFPVCAGIALDGRESRVSCSPPHLRLQHNIPPVGVTFRAALLAPTLGSMADGDWRPLPRIYLGASWSRRVFRYDIYASLRVVGGAGVVVAGVWGGVQPIRHSMLGDLALSPSSALAEKQEAALCGMHCLNNLVQGGLLARSGPG